MGHGVGIPSETQHTKAVMVGLFAWWRRPPAAVKKKNTTSVNAGERPNRRRPPRARQPRGFRKWRGSEENGRGAAPRRVWWPRRSGCQPRATFVPSRRAATEPSGFPRQRIKKACPRREYYCRYLFILCLYLHIMRACATWVRAYLSQNLCMHVTMCSNVLNIH